MTANHSRIVALLSAIAAAAALRLVPHPPNFSPIDAMALFSGAFLGRRSIAVVAPLAALLLSDVVLGFYPGMWVNYLAVALITVLGALALGRMTAVRLGGATVAGSVLFFIVSNFGVWTLSGMYPLSSTGLAACYVAALPFLQTTVAGDLFYVILLFGGFRLAEAVLPQVRARLAQPA